MGPGISNSLTGRLREDLSEELWNYLRANTREGFDLWQAGKLEESASKYQQALVLADPDHYALADYHGEFAAVLATLGRDAEALEQYREAVAVSVRQDPEESGLGIAVERYSLCEHLLKMNKPEEAIAGIEPMLHSEQA
jgi:tetratricopeptide (TPR) repeat protein